MGSLTTVLSGRRRSDRVSIAFPLEIAGVDSTGERFSEKTRTTTVSRYGCCLPLPRKLQPDQKVLLRRMGADETAIGRVVVVMGAHADGHLYGIETHNSCEGLWGIQFSSTFYEKLLDTMHEGVYFVNRDRKITYWNESAERVSGYSAREVVGSQCFDNLLGHVDECGRQLCITGCPLNQVMLDGKPRNVELYLQHKEGHRVPVSIRALPLRNNEGKIVGAVEVFTNSATRKATEKRVRELETLAFRDALTGLPTRRFLEMKLEQGLQEHRTFSRLYGLLMFDLDNFKRVNDTYGHEMGDAILKAVAETLMQGLRPVDIVGRWGGEEFLVLMPDLDAVRLGDLADRCRVLISQSHVPNGTSHVSVTASIGATVLSASDSPKSALARVDELMYQSKHSGGDRTTTG
ncbi:MAG: GGDEF domain-containing protein [Candidatus Sulfotelmatobacter sp.]